MPRRRAGDASASRDASRRAPWLPPRLPRVRASPRCSRSRATRATRRGPRRRRPAAGSPRGARDGRALDPPRRVFRLDARRTIRVRRLTVNPARDATTAGRLDDPRGIAEPRRRSRGSVSSASRRNPARDSRDVGGRADRRASMPGSKRSTTVRFPWDNAPNRKIAKTSPPGETRAMERARNACPPQKTRQKTNAGGGYPCDAGAVRRARAPARLSVRAARAFSRSSTATGNNIRCVDAKAREVRRAR